MAELEDAQLVQPELFPPIPIPFDIAEQMAAARVAFTLPGKPAFAPGQLFDLARMAVATVTGEIPEAEFRARLDEARLNGWELVIKKPFPPGTHYYALSID